MLSMLRRWLVVAVLLLLASMAQTENHQPVPVSASDITSATVSEVGPVAEAAASARLARGWSEAVDAAADSTNWKGYWDPAFLALVRLRDDHGLKTAERERLDAGIAMLLARAQVLHRYGRPPESDPTLLKALEQSWTRGRAELNRCRDANLGGGLCDVSAASAAAMPIVDALSHAADMSTRSMSEAHRAQLRSAAAALLREVDELGSPSALPLSFSVPTRVWERLAPTRAAGGAPGAKQADFAPMLPGVRHTTHGFADDEDAYFAAYGTARFGVTAKKSGWDCLRHYEILAAGAVPYVLGLDRLPRRTMDRWPRHLLAAATALPGVPAPPAVEACVLDAKAGRACALRVDPRLWNESAYQALRAELLDYAVRHLLSRHVAAQVNARGAATVIVHSEGAADDAFPNDFMRDLVVVGLAEAGVEVLATFDAAYLLQGHWPTHALRSRLYGRGFTLGGALNSTARLERIDASDVPLVAASIAASTAASTAASANASTLAREGTCAAMYVATTKSNGPFPASALAMIELFEGLFGVGCAAAVDGNDLGAVHAAPQGMGVGRALFRREALPTRISDF